MHFTALLPMKRNSDRVPGKNFKILGDRPLYRWILDSLLSVEAVDRVIINTDARDLLTDSGLVESDQLIIRERKPDLCGDFVSMNLVIEDDISAYTADGYVMTHTTNPFLSAFTIAEAIQTFRGCRKDADSLFTVSKVQTRFYRGDGSAVNHDPDNLIRTQDLEPWLEENSCLYVFTAESFARTGARIGERPELFETPDLESIDIDTQSDWDVAEGLAQTKFCRKT